MSLRRFLAAVLLALPLHATSPWAELYRQTEPWAYCKGLASDPCACKVTAKGVGAGVTCQGSTVVAIDLTKFDMKGTLKSSLLYKYTNLSSLSLAQNPDLQAAKPCVPGLPAFCLDTAAPTGACQLPSNVKACKPTSSPSRSPSRYVPTPPTTLSPTALPTFRPTHSPTSARPSYSPTRLPSQSPSAAPTRACSIRIGLVYSMTGPLQDLDPFNGAAVAVNRINAGHWANASLATPPGLVLSNLQCVFELIAEDDQSDPALHLDLVRELSTFVDFFITGTSENEAGAEAAEMTAAGRIALDCCLPSSPQYPPPIVDLPGQTNYFTFALPASAESYLTDFIQYMGYTVPRPRVGVVYNSSSAVNAQICSAAPAYAQAANSLPLLFTSPSPTLDLDVINASIYANGADVLISCFGVEASTALASYVAPLGLKSLFLASGPGLPQFAAALGDDAEYLTSAAQWHVALKYTDDLFGNTTAFVDDVVAYAGDDYAPGPGAAGAAAAVHILYAAITAEAEERDNETFSNLQVFLNSGAYAGIYERVQQVSLNTVFGPIQFDARNRNNQLKTVTTQLLPASYNQQFAITAALAPTAARVLQTADNTSANASDAPVLVAVFPLQYTTARYVYPMPSQVYCTDILGAPTLFGPWTGNYSELCTDAAVVSGNVPAGDVYKAVCSTCTPYYNVTECDAAGTRQVTTYPHLQSQVCSSSGDSLVLCDRYINFSAGQTVTIPCDYAPASSPAGAFLIVVLVFAALVQFVLMGLLWKYRETNVIMYAQIYPTMGSCMGGALMALGGIVFVGPNTTATCQLRTWLFNLTATVFFTPLFLKVYRVWLIFENPRLSRVVITNRRMARWMLSFLAVEIVWLIIWAGVAPTEPMCGAGVYTGLPSPVPTSFCGNTQVVFPIVAALILCCYVTAGVVLSFMARKVSRIFAEREIIAACLNVAVIGGAVALLYFFAGLSVQLNTFLVGFGLAWCSAVPCLILILPKLWLIWFKSAEYIESKAFGIQHKAALPALRSETGGPDVAALVQENEALKQELMKLKAAMLAGRTGKHASSERSGEGRDDASPNGTDQIGPSSQGESKDNMFSKARRRLSLMGTSKNEDDVKSQPSSLPSSQQPHHGKKTSDAELPRPPALQQQAQSEGDETMATAVALPPSPPSAVAPQTPAPAKSDALATV